MTHILVTGANGFVGKRVCCLARARAYQVTGFVRQAGGGIQGVRELLLHGTDFEDARSVWPTDSPVDCVIHLAARVHVMHDSSADSLAAYRRTNVAGALRVAHAASLAGARRFVFVSSVKALGEVDPGRPWCESDLATPADPYGQSKLEAENALFSLGREIGLNVVVVRPPLVYGPGVRANFLELIRAVQRRLPLPLGAVDSLRSMIFVDNLANALLLCATHPAAAGRLFHVSDGYDLSVADLAKALGRELERPARLISVSPSVLRLAARLCGRLAQVNRLIDPLRLDISRIGTELGWYPPHSTADGLRATVEWYRAAH